MYKIKITFSKQGYTKYISHLDLMRMFQRVFKIAGIDIAYSQGFNPHPKMSISHPLPVGVTGSCEYMEISLNSEPDFEDIKNRLNSKLPEGFEVICVEAADGRLSEIDRASYSVEIGVKSELPEFADYVDALKNKEDIVVAKRTKKGISNTDIQPAIYKMELIYADNKVFKFDMTLSVGEKMNLKVTSVLDAFKKYIPGFELDYYIINRNRLF